MTQIEEINQIALDFPEYFKGKDIHKGTYAYTSYSGASEGKSPELIIMDKNMPEEIKKRFRQVFRME